MARPTIRVGRQQSVDLFSDAEPIIRHDTMAHITCRVCGKPARVPIDHPALLCPLCIEDLDATAAHVQDGITTVLNRWEALNARWETTLSHSPAQARWAKVEAAIIAHGLQDATVQRTWHQRKAEGGAFADLLTAYEVYDRDNAQLARELTALTAARDEVNHAVLNAPLNITEKAA